ncbi:diguanylate cyclase [Arcobacter nitrofigilis DSM 7299]|uniref:Diguanylate cyclase n=1 Tax=Arcobacter nitrofigilis (strain ATCC 33309 / DSM 7299 / CCUG 15893 / LMG 7604 / NCTC 12251 / CI) TaxID=572480 RepID=D5UZQ4_ARCNC|nr:GGDEF domain-containing protein [Arcobacter nitrofigilis]ADG93273.1 diguanylate cyclase [Arcobacter nitrofigilis DSM 7299]
MLKNSILNLIKSSCNHEKDFASLEKIYELYEQLQYSSNLKQMAEDIYLWLNRNYNVDNVTFSLFDMKNNRKENIYVKGEEFYLDDDKSFFFIINTHTSQNAIVSFSSTSKTHFIVLEAEYNAIESAFFQISPIIQSGILKKNYVQANSIDSVTNVYNRQYLTEHVNKLINLSHTETNDIFFLMIGIDRFKAVIDEFDYDIGDKVLIELAKIIHTNISEFDLVARLSGDEFLVSILSSDNESEVRVICENIIQDFANAEIQINEEATLKKTICIGYDKFNTKDSSLDQIIKNTDTALYEAKNKGRSSFLAFSDIKEEDNIDLF